MTEEPAINVKQECADVYYDNLKLLPERIKKVLSVDALAEIFRIMVVPAIDKARAIDRGVEQSNQKRKVK